MAIHMSKAVLHFLYIFVFVWFFRCLYFCILYRYLKHMFTIHFQHTYNIYLYTNIHVYHVYHIYQGRIQGGAHAPGAPPPKIVIFHTKYPKIFAPPSVRRNFCKCAPLTWNPGSALVYHIIYTIEHTIDNINYIFIEEEFADTKRGDQNPYMEEEQTTQWSKEKVQTDKQRSTKQYT